jgi:hypothetical protein
MRDVETGGFCGASVSASASFSGLRGRSGFQDVYVSDQQCGRLLSSSSKNRSLSALSVLALVLVGDFLLVTISAIRDPPARRRQVAIWPSAGR